MINKDVVLGKVRNIQNCQRRMNELTRRNQDTLMNFDIQDAFMMNLIRCMQASIDLAAHVIAAEELGIPNDLSENFRILGQAKIIDADLAQKLEKMAGFRNVAIHEYTTVDLAILKVVHNDHLKDFEDFYRAILKYVGMKDS